jgi:type II secretion system protein H
VHPPRPQRAFTLLELLLVLALVAVLAALAGPRMSGALKGQRLDAQARTVIAYARKARALAAAEGRSYDLVFDPVAKTLRLARQRDPLAAPSDPEDPEREALDEALAWARPLPFEDGVELSEATATQNTEGGANSELETESLDLAEPVAVRFAPDGSAQARELAFRVGPREVRIRVRPHLGRAELVEPEAAQ